MDELLNKYLQPVNDVLFEKFKKDSAIVSEDVVDILHSFSAIKLNVTWGMKNCSLGEYYTYYFYIENSEPILWLNIKDNGTYISHSWDEIPLIYSLYLIGVIQWSSKVLPHLEYK